VINVENGSRKILGKNHEQDGKNEIQELHAKEVGVGNPSEERANS
jgi:hypothetical protein